MTELVMRNDVIYEDSIQVQIKNKELRFSKSFTVKGISVAEGLDVALNAFKKENIEIRRYNKNEKTIK